MLITHPRIALIGRSNLRDLWKESSETDLFLPFTISSGHPQIRLTAEELSAAPLVISTDAIKMLFCPDKDLTPGDGERRLY